MDPNGVYSTKREWVDKDGKPVDQTSPAKYREYIVIVYNDGRKFQRLWVPQAGEGGGGEYGATDSQVATQFRADTKPAGSTTSQWVTKVDPSTGKTYRLNEATGEMQEVFGAEPTDPEEEALRRRLLTAQVTNAERGPQAPLGRQLPPAELQLQDLQVQKAQRDLMNPQLLAQQQAQEALTAIQAQIARGEITLQEGTKLMMLTRANLQAALRGTTPFQMQQQQQNLARGYLGDRAQTGSSMASGLLSGLGGIYGKIYSGTGAPLMNPLDIAGGFTEQQYGGPQMADRAKALLTGAFQPQEGM